jgi:hypothetical protein
MTIATHDEDRVGTSAPHARSQPSESPRPGRWPSDVIGVLAVLVAATGLVGTIVLLRPTPEATPHSVSSPPLRDTWYLDAPSVSVQNPVAVHSATVADRWWEDAQRVPAGVSAVHEPPQRDRWYLDAAPTNPGTPKLSAPARDQWYLDQQDSRAAIQP